ncbi:MAG: SH3 domain-containing protein [Nitrospirota bacterium]|nr:SH3 domain-containing protein [Nitrospirota bacterium]
MTRTKTLIICSVAFFLALAVSSAIFAQSSPSYSSYINFNVSINVREGPGVRFRSIGSVEPGDRVQVIGKQAGWAKVRPEGKALVGWVAGSFVSQGTPPVILIEEHNDALAKKDAEIEALKRENESFKRLVGTLPKEFLRPDVPVEEMLKRQVDYYDRLIRLKWFMGGGVLFVVGLLFGVLVGRGRRRSQKRLMLD